MSAASGHLDILPPRVRCKWSRPSTGWTASCMGGCTVGQCSGCVPSRKWLSSAWYSLRPRTRRTHLDGHLAHESASGLGTRLVRTGILRASQGCPWTTPNMRLECHHRDILSFEDICSNGLLPLSEIEEEEESPSATLWKEHSAKTGYLKLL